MTSLVANRDIVRVFYVFLMVLGILGEVFLDTGIMTYFMLYWKW